MFSALPKTFNKPTCIFAVLEPSANNSIPLNYFNQQSERLKFRPLTESDIPTWVGFFKDNDRLRFLGIDESRSHESLAEEWIASQFKRYDEHGLGHLAATLKETGEMIGMGAIIPRELNGKSEFEIAYSLIPKFWGKGFATEIAKQMKCYAVKHIETDRFISIIHIDNLASARVAEKNNMKVLFQTEFLGMKVNVFGQRNSEN